MAQRAMTGAAARRLGPAFWCIAGNVLFGTGLVFHAFLYNFYLDELGFSPAVMGYAAAALTAGGLVMLLPAGRLVDEVGPGYAAVLAGAVTSAGLALGAWVERPLPVYLTAGIAGAGGAIWRVTVAPALMRLTDAGSRARVFAWNVGFILLAGAAVMALAGATPSWLQARLGVSPPGSVRIALLLGAATTGVSMAFFWALRLSREKGAGETTVATGVSGTERARVAREMLPFVGVVAVWMLGAAMVAPFFNIYFARRFALSMSRVGLVLGMAQAVWAGGVIASGEVATRLGPRMVLPAAAMVLAPALWGLAASGRLAVAAALFLVQGIVGPVTNPLIDQVLLSQVPRPLHGTLSGWRNVAADVSGIIGASVGGLLLAARGFGALLGVAGGVGLVGAVGLDLWLRRRDADLAGQRGGDTTTPQTGGL